MTPRDACPVAIARLDAHVYRAYDSPASKPSRMPGITPPPPFGEPWPPKASKAIPTIATAVHSSQRRDRDRRSKTRSSRAAKTGPLPKDTTLPIATPARSIDA